MIPLFTDILELTAVLFLLALTYGAIVWLIGVLGVIAYNVITGFRYIK